MEDSKSSSFKNSVHDVFYVCFYMKVCLYVIRSSFSVDIIIIIIIITFVISRVFTVIYLKQTMILQHIVLRLFCIYNLCCFYNSTFRSTCAVPNIAVFFSSIIILPCTVHEIPRGHLSYKIHEILAGKPLCKTNKYTCPLML